MELQQLLRDLKAYNGYMQSLVVDQQNELGKLARRQEGSTTVAPAPVRRPSPGGPVMKPTMTWFPLFLTLALGSQLAIATEDWQHRSSPANG